VRSLMTRRLLAAGAGFTYGRRGLRRAGQHPTRAGGRWSLLPPPVEDYDPDELAEAIAEQLAVRWGVVFRDLLVRENIAVPWREILWAFRRLEARGVIRGGRFVNGFSGEQFGHPDAVEVLREVRKQARNGETITLSAVDPLNLVGVILPGPRVPAVRTNTVTYVDGAVSPLPAVDGAEQTALSPHHRLGV
jgi:ATP-dependent Lhr-like helicase